MKNDKFKSARGGYSRLLDITCDKCNSHICFYQKDGAGTLKRLYLDRMLDISTGKNDPVCHHCEQILGTYIIYQKEKRPAYRLYVGSVRKKIVNSHEVKL